SFRTNLLLLHAIHHLTLRSLSTSSSTMYRQLASLTEKLNQISSQVAPAASVLNAAPVREPHAPTPERYNGDFGVCQAFLTQVSLVFELQPHSYPTDRSRIAYLIGLLTGDARDWGTAVWKRQGPLCNSYSAFVEEMPPESFQWTPEADRAFQELKHQF
uniref:DUF4939 domain-containing protein n=1 Tax=Amphiprion ocellaris TaxID=80972 RepID=A0AAQ5X026_AMPOC